MYNDFKKDLKDGLRGEKLFMDAMAARRHNVEDLRNDAEYRKKDVDFRISKNGVEVLVEVKNDIKSNYTNNVYVELTNNNNKSRNFEGWFCYCEADYIAFVQEQHNKIHLVQMNELIKNCWDNKYRVAASYDTTGYIVPIHQLEKYITYHCLNLGV